VDQQSGGKEMKRIGFAVVITFLLANPAVPRLSDKQITEIVNSVFARGKSTEETLNRIKRNLPRLDHKIPEERGLLGLLYLTQGQLLLHKAQGDAVANARSAITSFKTALQELTLDDNPEWWTDAKFALSTAHSQLGRNTINSDEAVAAINELRDLTTDEIRGLFPKKWIDAERNLASLYYDRVERESSMDLRSENLELAIAAIQAALSGTSANEDPKQWADLQGWLAQFYSERTSGDWADNAERSLQARLAAARSISRELQPRVWAEAQASLGNAYLSRPHTHYAEDFEAAIRAYEAALTVWTAEADPQEWAKVSGNLAVAYRGRSKGDRKENILRAIAIDDSLSRNPIVVAKPSDWSGVQMNLANDYLALPDSDKDENYDKAIAAASESLPVLQRIGDNRRLANVYHNLAYMFLDRPRGERSANLDQAILYNQAELRLRDESGARGYLLAAQSLAEGLDKANRLEEAKVYHEKVLESFDRLEGEGYNFIGLRQFISQYGAIFETAAWNAYKRGDLAGAFYFAESGRARMLDVSLRTQLRLRDLSSDDRKTFIALWNQLAALEEQRSQEIGQVQLTEAAIRRADKADLIRKQMRAMISWQKDRSVARPMPSQGTAIVMPLITNDLSVLLFASDRGYFAQELDHEQLGLIFRGPESWSSIYPVIRKTLMNASEFASSDYVAQEKVEQFQRDYDGLRARISNLAQRLWKVVGGPLRDGLAGQGVQPGARLTILPSSTLAVIPFWMAQDRSTGGSLLDMYDISFAFSLRELEARPADEAKPRRLTAWFNLQADDLPFTRAESLMVPQAFSESRTTVLSDAEFDTPASVLKAFDNSQTLHLSTHGEAKRADAINASLNIAGFDSAGHSRTIKLGDVLGRVLHDAPELVTISACESGIPDLSVHEEYLGFPSALVMAGAKGVISSLWPVPDDSTALLFSKFYALYGQGVAAPTALRSAQLWLRDATSLELSVYVLKYFRNEQRNDATARLGPLLRRLRMQPADARPYHDQIYWAGFSYYGGG
jgi:CHAT domain-containing protein